MRRRFNSARGSAFILSIWMILTLAFLAVGLAQGARQKALIFSRLDEKEERRLLTESMIKKISADLKDPQTSLMRGRVNGGWVTQGFSGSRGAVTLKIEDENSKINLNTSGTDVLTRLFRLAARLDEADAGRLAAAVADFRDGDDFLGGTEEGPSEKGDTRQAGLLARPKNGPLEYPGELMAVRGMTKEIYNLIEKYITIYGDGKINFNTCEKEAMTMAGLLPELCEKIIQIRNRKSADAAPVFTDAGTIEEILSGFYFLTDDEKDSLHRVLERGLAGVSSDYFKITSRASRNGEGNALETVCVMGIRDGIRYWAER